MKISMASIADEANISQDGKLNILGIFDRIAAADFPVVHPKMVFAFRVQADFGDGGRSFPVAIQLMDGDDQVMFEATGEVNPPVVPFGEFSTAPQVFALVGLQFPSPGLYRFVVTLAGQQPHETPLLVSYVPQQPRNEQLN